MDVTTQLATIGGDDFSPVFREQSQSPFEQTADKDRADNGRITVVRADEAQDRDEGEAYAHNDRQARSDTPDGVQLNTGRDTGDEQGGLDKLRRLAAGQTAGACDDNHRGDVREEHREYMLQAQRDRIGERNPSFETGHIGQGNVGRAACRILFLHEYSF